MELQLVAHLDGADGNGAERLGVARGVRLRGIDQRTSLMADLTLEATAEQCSMPNAHCNPGNEGQRRVCSESGWQRRRLVAGARDRDRFARFGSAEDLESVGIVGLMMSRALSVKRG